MLKNIIGILVLMQTSALLAAPVVDADYQWEISPQCAEDPSLHCEIQRKLNFLKAAGVLKNGAGTVDGVLGSGTKRAMAEFAKLINNPIVLFDLQSLDEELDKQLATERERTAPKLADEAPLTSLPDMAVPAIGQTPSTTELLNREIAELKQSLKDLSKGREDPRMAVFSRDISSNSSGLNKLTDKFDSLKSEMKDSQLSLFWTIAGGIFGGIFTILGAAWSYFGKIEEKTDAKIDDAISRYIDKHAGIEDRVEGLVGDVEGKVFAEIASQADCVKENEKAINSLNARISEFRGEMEEVQAGAKDAFERLRHFRADLKQLGEAFRLL